MESWKDGRRKDGRRKDGKLEGWKGVSSRE